MQAIAYRENIDPIRAKSMFLVRKPESRKCDSNRPSRFFAKWKLAYVRRVAANSLSSHQTMADAKVWGSKKENSSAAKAADYSQRK